MVRLFLALLLAAAVAPAARAETPLTRGDVETIVRDYLLANPEVLEEAFTALQAKRQTEADAARAGALADNRDRLISSPLSAVIGNPDGDVTLVEFFDYNCTYCRHALDDLEKLIAGDPKLRVVLKEFPVLGQGSMEAAAVSIVVHEIAPETYDDFHRALMALDAHADEAAALEIAGRLGLPVDDIRERMRSERVKATVRENYDLAQSLGLTGTPSYVVGDKVEFGAVGYETLVARVNEARCGTETC
jgi:protein-disulfide isomerase